MVKLAAGVIIVGIIAAFLILRNRQVSPIVEIPIIETSAIENLQAQLEQTFSSITSELAGARRDLSTVGERFGGGRPATLRAASIGLTANVKRIEGILAQFLGANPGFA